MTLDAWMETCIETAIALGYTLDDIEVSFDNILGAYYNEVAEGDRQGN